jgi:hypothetical protein
MVPVLPDRAQSDLDRIQVALGQKIGRADRLTSPCRSGGHRRLARRDDRSRNRSGLAEDTVTASACARRDGARANVQNRSTVSSASRSAMRSLSDLPSKKFLELEHEIHHAHVAGLQRVQHRR